MESDTERRARLSIGRSDDDGLLRFCRFVYSPTNGRYTWKHRLELQPNDVDCTNMDDEEFARFVLQQGVKL